MIRLIPINQKHYTTENTKHLPFKVLIFCIFCRFHIFCNSVPLKYVDTVTYHSEKMRVNIDLTLSKLKIVYNHRGWKFSLTPDYLISCFIEFVPLFLSNAVTLSFSLVTLFFRPLPLEL